MTGRLLSLALLALPGVLAAGPAAAEEPLETACISTDLPARLALSFPDSRDGRTRMEASIGVGEADWPAAARSFRVEGELARRERRVESFRYRFAPPAEPGPATLAFVRRPAAGRYRFLLRVLDETTGRCLVETRELDVPALGAAPTEDAPLPAAVRLFVGHGALLTGKVRFDADVRGEEISRLAFELDGRRVLTRGRPPWSVELDLGTAPRLHRLAAVGLDPHGREVARDEVLLNSGPHRFAVRLSLAPWSAAADRAIEARAVVEIPEGEELASLELFVNDELRATLYQPPYTVALPRPAGGESAWVRAVAHLSDGGDAEATRFLGSRAAGEVVDVDFVELLATVVDRSGRPVDDLRADEVELLENGRPQTLRRLDRVEDVPIHAAVMIDTSDSMVEELDDALRAADRFFREVLTSRDRAAVVTFADEPHLAVRFTSNVERLAGGLADLAAQGTTRLYDAVAFGLHYFSGIQGKRALVLLSDGEDAGSELRFDDVLDYARRSGVAIYTIGMNVKSTPPDFGLVLDRLARETGGLSFRIRRAHDLGRIYEQIESELRAQYLIAYQSDASAGSDYRAIEVEVRRPGVEARTAPGYYP